MQLTGKTAAFPERVAPEGSEGAFRESSGSISNRIELPLARQVIGTKTLPGVSPKAREALQGRRLAAKRAMRAGKKGA